MNDLINIKVIQKDFNGEKKNLLTPENCINGSALAGIFQIG